MNLLSRLAIAFSLCLLSLACWVTPVGAQVESPPALRTPAAKWVTTSEAGESLTLPSPNRSFLEKLERLREDRQLQELVEEDLEKSIAIRGQIQEEVDRAFSHTTTLLNVLLGVLTFLPILTAVSIWFIRRSVLNQIIAETKKQLKDEVEMQLEAEVASEFRKQTEAFQQKVAQLEAEFEVQLAQLKTLYVNAQAEKDQIIQELAQLTPSPIREGPSPETQQKIHALTKQLELLKSANLQLSFTANDYVEQGKALYAEGRSEEAIAVYDKALQMEPENTKAWLSRGAALARLQNYEEAIAAYNQAIHLKPEFSEAWFAKGMVLTKVQQLTEAIAAYDKATILKPDFFLAWFGKARCYALQGQVDLSLEALEQAIALNADKAREAARTDPMLDALRTVPQFQALMAVGLNQ